jgi:hypothetical protein
MPWHPFPSVYRVLVEVSHYRPRAVQRNGRVPGLVNRIDVIRASEIFGMFIPIGQKLLVEIHTGPLNIRSCLPVYAWRHYQAKEIAPLFCEAVIGAHIIILL